MKTLVTLIALSATAVAQVTAVESVGVTVSDLERELTFFTTVLGCEHVSTVEDAGPAHEELEGVFALRKLVARLRLGDEVLELTQYLAPEGRAYPADSRSNDRWFQHVAIVVPHMERAYAHLRAHGVRHASSGPQRLPDWNPNAGGIEAFYFKDPEGHVLEAIAFPPDKGDPKWHRLAATEERLFLGIDHTAIVVADTDASVAIYRDVLGLRVAGASENHGTEQEHLNAVFGARLRITSLRAADGPGVELLEYLSPGDGRPYPEARSCDLVHWETRLAVADLSGIEQRLRSARVRFVSPGATALPSSLALLVRDPDGHALELHQTASE